MGASSVLFLSISTLTLAACSAGGGGTSPEAPGVPSGSGGGASNNVGGAPSGVGGSDMIGGLIGRPGSAGPDAGANNCGGPSLLAEREIVTVDAGTVIVNRPVAMFIMIDQSLSMIEPGAAAGSTKWSTLKDGFTSFVNDPKSAGIDAALGFFPPLFGSPGDCTGAGYDTPAVPMGQLNGNAAPIANALASTALPSGFGTPTEGGLRGAESFCAKYQVAHPDEDCVVVFATDGQPSTCDQNLTDLEKIVSDTLANSHVRTFAIGMAGATAGEVDFNFLNALARAGGTDCNPTNPGNEACNVGGGSDLTTALNTIRAAVAVHQTKQVVRTSALTCVLKLPTQKYDKDQVNVTFKDSSGTVEQLLRADTEADCSKAPWAWYYDDVAAPTNILLCPNTCSSINAGRDAGALSATAPGINVQLGCPSAKIR